MYKFFLKPLFFLLPPERAHYTAMAILRAFCSVGLLRNLLSQYFSIDHKALERHAFGFTFKNPIGLAAGFDKNGDYIAAIHALGFGFTELGTVTPRAQFGNEKPRLFRLKKSDALINRLGFNNKGVNYLVKKLIVAKRLFVLNADTSVGKKNFIIGGNIGKNKTTLNENAVADYLTCFDALFDHVDYFTVNISSPNTPNLRDLQEKEPLDKLLAALQTRNAEYAHQKPILLKIAPDLSNEAIDDILEVVLKNKLAGIVATNTTVLRTNLKEEDDAISKMGVGGLSGAPLRKRSTEVIRYIRQKISDPDFVIIGVGGINIFDDAIEKLEAGATLLQLYTGFVYEGPTIAKKINSALVAYFLKEEQKN